MDLTKAHNNKAIKEIINELLVMTDEEFRAELKAHENSELGMAMLDIAHWGREHNMKPEGKMNIQKTILNKKSESGLDLIDVICELVEESEEIDYFDVADAIKDNATMMAVLLHEFKSRNMIAHDAEEVNLTEIFKEL